MPGSSASGNCTSPLFIAPKPIGWVRAISTAAASAGEFAHVDAVPLQHFRGIQTVDRAEGIEPVDGGNGSFVFNFGQATQAHHKLVVLVSAGDFTARLLDVPDR